MNKKNNQPSLIECAAQTAFEFADAWVVAAVIFIFALIVLILRIKKRKKKGL